MIHKNVTIDKVKNVTIIEFGKGTLSIVGGLESLWIKEIEPKTPIGSITKEAPYDINEFSPDIRIFFGNKEGFNVFFDHVLKIKEHFDNEVVESVI